MAKNIKDKRQTQREKEREKKQRKNRKYGQGNLKHAKRGVFSCMISAFIGFMFLMLLLVSYASKGEARSIIGLVGIACLVFAWFGLMMGLRGFGERDKNYLTCKIGVGINGFLVLSFLIVFIRGLI